MTVEECEFILRSAGGAALAKAVGANTCTKCYAYKGSVQERRGPGVHEDYRFWVYTWHIPRTEAGAYLIWDTRTARLQWISHNEWCEWLGDVTQYPVKHYAAEGL